MAASKGQVRDIFDPLTRSTPRKRPSTCHFWFMAASITMVKANYGPFLFRPCGGPPAKGQVRAIFGPWLPPLRGPLLLLLLLLLDATSGSCYFLVRLPGDEKSWRDPLHMVGGYQHCIVT